MLGLRFILILIGALALHADALAAQPAPAQRTLASFAGNDFVDGGTSPSGRFILMASATKLRMFDVARRQSWDLVDGSVQGPRWSPKGDMIVFARVGSDGPGHYVWAMPVDASTGKPRGPAQRVSVGRVNPNDGGVAVQISVDSRWIAFAAVDSGRAMTLSIVPATGGPERAVAKFPRGIFNFDWSLDSRTIYVNAPAPDGNLAVLKVRVDNGATDVIRSQRDVLAGMTADRRYLVLLPMKNPIADGDMGTVIDTTGREVGQFSPPAGRLMFDRVLGDSALVWLTSRDLRVLEVRPVAGGPARRLPLIGESNDGAAWSPDGKRIALQVLDGSRASLAVMSADGSKPRVFRETTVPTISWGSWYWWSPDSRKIAFLSSDQHTLSLLDVAAGTHRTILQDTAVQFLVGRWRADGQAIRLASRRNPGSTPGKRIDEVTVNGQHRTLLELPLRTDLFHGFQLVGDSNVFVRSDSVAFLMPLGTGPTRRLAGVTPGTQLFNTVVSSDLRWIGGLHVVAGGGPARQVEVFSTETGGRTVLDLPFEGRSYRPEFIPGDSSLLVFGQRSGEPNIKIYRVPFNGTTPRVFADVGWPRQQFAGATASSASPDGQLLLYSVQPENTTQALVLIDLRGAIPRATSRAPRK